MQLIIIATEFQKIAIDQESIAKEYFELVWDICLELTILSKRKLGINLCFILCNVQRLIRKIFKYILHTPSPLQNMDKKLKTHSTNILNQVKKEKGDALKIIKKNKINSTNILDVFLPEANIF